MDTRIFGALRPALVVGLLVLSALALAGPTSASAAPLVAKTKQYPAMAPGDYEARVQHWINVRRADHDRRPLRFASCPDQSAERWSGHLARSNRFYHQSMEAVLERCSARYAGETLGRGAITPRRLVRMWMESDGHRHVLLSGKSHRIGIGAKPDAYGRWVVAANFIRF